jgi:hypothetical protein
MGIRADSGRTHGRSSATWGRLSLFLFLSLSLSLSLVSIILVHHHHTVYLQFRFRSTTHRTGEEWSAAKRCLYAHVSVSVYAMCTSKRARLCMSICIQQTYVYTRVSMHACMHACMRVCVCVCVCVCVSVSVSALQVECACGQKMSRIMMRRPRKRRD